MLQKLTDYQYSKEENLTKLTDVFPHLRASGEIQGVQKDRNDCSIWTCPKEKSTSRVQGTDYMKNEI